MKNKLSLLILTKHKKHSIHNSVYELTKALFKNRQIARLDIASSSISNNDKFFQGKTNRLYVKEVDDNFSYETSRDDNYWLEKEVNFKDYDFIFLRLPPPLDQNFVKNISKILGANKIINNPMNALKYGSKKALLNFNEFCPPIKHVKTLSELEKFNSKYPDIVLKPLNEHGGIGIVRVKDKIVQKENTENNTSVTVKDYWNSLAKEKQEFLAMKFLEGVSEGDKRIIVVNGKVILTVLRKSASGSWLCNVSQGGHEMKAKITRRERKMAKELSKVLVPKGVVFFAIDTLEENGVRYISEINCTSVGGIAPAEKLYNKNFTKKISKQLVKYMLKK